MLDLKKAMKVMVNKMAKSKKKSENPRKEKLQKKDLNYRRAIEINCINQQEMQLIQTQYMQDLKKMNEEIRTSMEHYYEAQCQLIELKLKEEILSETPLNQSIKEICRQYEEILKMYERINEQKK